jgi:5'-nucleotidase (lipoprotein e(P4) family)
MNSKTCIICLITIACITMECVVRQPKLQYNLNSTLWIQTASEYKASSIQAFNAAEKMIHEAISDTSWTSAIEQGHNYSQLPPAIILDIDETVLDNSQYQAQLVINGAEFGPASWDRWVAMKSAPAVPGSVDFINSMTDMGIEVIYITNRECKPRSEGGPSCPQEKDIIDNLIKVGIKAVKPENILLKKEKPEWSSEKKSRREAVASNYRIVMLFGDELGDFIPDIKKDITPVQRDSLVNKYRKNWGIKWFVLSNPAYGSWMEVLSDPKSSHLKGYLEYHNN